MIRISDIIHLTPVAIAGLLPLTGEAKEVARFPMVNNGGMITEVVSGATYAINSVHPAENIPGAKGMSLRFDGYSTYVDAAIGDIIPAGSKKMTASVWFAIETYPIVELDVNTGEQVAVVSCLDDIAKTGFGFFVGFDGRYSFKTYVGGWPLELKGETPLNKYEWINLTAVVDTEARIATLYNNGVPVASSKANGGLTVEQSTLRIGRSFNERFSGPFCLTSINGLVDDIAVWDDALNLSDILEMIPDKKADLSIPVSRFAGDPMRPTFHGMPGANWTNETHGLTYYNGRYHLFFQKNANGPYMARLHWGHLSSENLYEWTEEPIALTPGAPYDIKGCWSGCVFADEEITQGKPSILYTGVDYGKAVIAQANPADDNLLVWDKKSMPVINGRPNGLSDDFRDPYFFRSDGGAYIIVGSSKGGIGTTTLHSYNPKSKSWSNDGKTFFSGTNASTCGTFWEMPNITKIGDKWLFTVTPQNTSKGVASLYWVGSINPDGTFSPDKAAPANIEFAGFARDGFGMLSPTIYQHNGKTIALGIVPDKLPSQANYDLGYAHTYSLPREWSVDADGNLCQKPYSRLSEMRQGKGFTKSDFTLDGDLTMNDVKGRAIELIGEFTVGSGKCGFRLLDDGVSAIKIFYDATTNEIVIDTRGVDRLINDSGVFDGCYHSALPRQLAKGETVKLNLFFDHSILDIFVNDTWASSVRVFAKTKAVENVAAFADTPCQVNYIKGWNLDAADVSTGIDTAISDSYNIIVKADAGILTLENVCVPASMTVCDISGKIMITKSIETASVTVDTNLHGLHIVTVASADGMTSKKVMF